MTPTRHPAPAWFDDALARAVALGGTRVMEPAETPVSRIAAFADPDGNLIGLLSR